MHSRYSSLPLFLLVVLLSISAAACAAKGKKKNDDVVKGPPKEKVDIADDQTNNGIFDISVEYDDKGVGWMAYSRVTLPKYVETKIARSKDHGKTWKYVTTVNESEDGEQKIDGKVVKGVWRHETPSLLYDPSDKEDRRWKLFSQKYLAVPPYKKGNSKFDHGWIEYKTAASPRGPWSEPIRLFGSKESASRVDPNALNKGLRKNAFYNEIGTIEVDGVIYMSVDSSTTSTGVGDWDERKVVLFASKDHAASWSYVGTLTDFDDAGEFGYLIFTGSSLVREGDRLYLMASPAGKKGLFVKTRGHDGTYVFEFEDISKAKLKRDNDGKLLPVKKIAIDKGMHSGGLSDYDEQNTAGGIMFSQLTTEKSQKPEFFQVFSTTETIR